MEVQALRWFHGFISFEQAANELKGQAKGTYLARFSHSNPDAIVLAYVSEGGDVKQSLVQKSNNGYSLGGKIYPNVSTIIASHEHKLRTPLNKSGDSKRNTEFAVDDSPYAFGELTL